MAEIEESIKPQGWTWTTLGECFPITMGQSPSSSTYNQIGDGLPFFQGKAEFGDVYPVVIKYCSDPTKLAEKGDILITVRAPVGPTNIAPELCCIGRGLAAIHPICGVQSTFILYLLRFLESSIARKGTGTTFKAINGPQLRKIDFLLPPLPEQYRVVAKIEELFTRLDAGVDILKQVQVQLKQYRQAVLKAAVEGRLTAQWREEYKSELEPASELLQRILKERREKWETEQLAKYDAKGQQPPKNWREKYKEPQQPDTSNLPELPEGWVWASAEQCTSLITDGEHLTPERSTSGVYLLSARNVLDGRLSLEKVDYIPTRVHEKIRQRLQINAGDVLLSCSGTVGRSCVVPQDVQFSLVRSVAVLKPVGCMGEYLSYSLRSPQLQSQISQKKTQTAQANIFQGKIKTLLFTLCPSREQEVMIQLIGMHFTHADALGQIVDNEISRLEGLRRSILNQAFEGKLVPQDPEDESAQVLLERIKAEKVKGEAEHKAKRSRKNSKQVELGV